MNIPLLERRKIEAGTLGAVYAHLKKTQGTGAALGVIRATVEAVAFEAGQAFAASAPDGPSFEHFQTIVDVWKGTGVLDIDNVKREPDVLTFDVTRCGYVDGYRGMGLPEELIPVISCPRDEPFAAGYSERIVFSRPETIGDGFGRCGFRFEWK